MLGSYNDEDIYLFRTDDPEGSDFTHRYQVQHHVLVASVIHPHVASLLSTLMLPSYSSSCCRAHVIYPNVAYDIHPHIAPVIHLHVARVTGTAPQ